MAAPKTIETIMAQRRDFVRCFGSASFQRASGPTPMRKTSGSIRGPKTASKYGGPTEILPAFKASRKSG